MSVTFRYCPSSGQKKDRNMCDRKDMRIECFRQAEVKLISSAFVECFHWLKQGVWPKLSMGSSSYGRHFVFMVTFIFILEVSLSQSKQTAVALNETVTGNTARTERTRCSKFLRSSILWAYKVLGRLEEGQK